MAGLKFRRADLNIFIRRDDRGRGRIEVFAWGTPEVYLLPAAVVRAWLNRSEAIPIAALRKFPLMPRALLPWLALTSQVHPPLEAQESLVPRVTLEIADRELAALPWEEALLMAYGIGGLPVVRVCPVFPHVEDIALTLPLRFLQVDPGTDFRLAQSVQAVFGGHSTESVTLAVETAECTLDTVAASREKSKWPTAEILQFDQLRMLRESEKLLSTASPDLPGTLGWLSRLPGVWQTRLVILRTDGDQSLANARRLLAALAARGGPAGLAIGDNAPQFLPHFYEQVIHDAPLDIACIESLRRIPEGTQPSLFIGAWRAESLRASRIASGIQEFGIAFQSKQQGTVKVGGGDFILKDSDPSGGQSTGKMDFNTDLTIPIKEFELDEKGLENLGKLLKFRSLQDFNPNLPQTKELIKVEEVKKQFIKLKNLSHYVGGLEFHSHESGGMLPLAKELHTFRKDFGLQPEVVGVITAAEQLEPVTRYVNPSLWKRSEGKIIRLKPSTDSPFADQSYQLGVQIGSQDLEEVVILQRGLIKEQIKWDSDKKGAWIEVGVTGLDFEVIGDPVQELWLPIGADSDRIHFTVVPRKAGVARLRYCIYNEQNLIQSHRLVAWVNSPGVTPPADGERREQLAEALGVPLEQLPPGTHYAWRCEYSLTADVAGIVNRPARALSIAANDWNGESVITVKGADKFDVSTPGDLKDYVQRVRETLHRASCQKGSLPDDPQYAFGLKGDWNAADADMLREPLQELARAGWDLYDQIFPESMRTSMEAKLAQEDPIIAVANILAEKVIPWSLLYSRKYRAGMKKSNGRPVAYDTCLAAVPDKDGKLPIRQCGQHPNCLLHPDQITQREQAGKPQLLAETVACPLHFWGFRHIIESPAQQAAPGEKLPARPVIDHVTSAGPPKAVSGFNSSLRSHADHLKVLQGLFDPPAEGKNWSATSSHDEVVEKLTGDDLQVIYLFCHARKSDDTGASPPCLEFDGKGFVKAGDLSHTSAWTTHPLVFLNGCETAAFSPEALSPFVRKFVRDRGAAGVIGTEAPVWERLAAEFAEVFFRNFLAGSSAGNSLLVARRVLLSKLNPLGLTYTLYASAGLELKSAPAAKTALPQPQTTSAASA